MAEGRHFPAGEIGQYGLMKSVCIVALLKYSNDSCLCLVIYQIVDFEITVYYCGPVTGSCFWVFEEGHHLVKVGDLADGLMRLDVNSFGLSLGDGGESPELPIIEARGLAKGGDANRGGGHAVELCEGADGCSPPVLN